ncbi:hypothetical protein NQZ68_003243 [Dissostichus eleginoides]|nr:hypothetical protein NQZ68_003243 [Dissostichus eleginoides]
MTSEYQSEECVFLLGLDECEHCNKASDEHHGQSEFPGAQGGALLVESTAIPGLDEWDYWAEGSFNLGINMWTV